MVKEIENSLNNHFEQFSSDEKRLRDAAFRQIYYREYLTANKLFFSGEHFELWRKYNLTTKGKLLSLNEAAKLGRYLWKDIAV